MNKVLFFIAFIMIPELAISSENHEEICTKIATYLHNNENVHFITNEVRRIVGNDKAKVFLKIAFPNQGETPTSPLTSKSGDIEGLKSSLAYQQIKQKIIEIIGDKPARLIIGIRPEDVRTPVQPLTIPHLPMIYDEYTDSYR